MRINRYEFPEGTNEQILLEHGCGVVTTWGETIFPESIPEEHRKDVDYIDNVIVVSVTTAKKLLKEFGGAAWTEHYERNGGLFEISPITLKGNNSRFKYNRHL